MLQLTVNPGLVLTGFRTTLPWALNFCSVSKNGRQLKHPTANLFFVDYNKVKHQNTTKWTVIYSVKILIVIYWSAKAFNYAIYKHVSAPKLISTLEPAEDLTECGCIFTR